MNTPDNLMNELRSRFGNGLQITSPQGERFRIDGEQAFFVLTGSVDLFFAERKEDGTTGFAIPLCPRIEAGALIPPMAKSERICCFGRCLPDSKIVMLPWRTLRDGDPDNAPFVLNALLAFAAVFKPEKPPRNTDDVMQLVSDLCAGLEQKLQLVDIQTRKLILDHATEQKRQDKNIFTAFASLLQNSKHKKYTCDPADPVAAAAILTAQKSGFDKFVFAKGENVDHRLERSAEINRMRITPAMLNDGWYRENFAAMLIVSEDGQNAYCAYRNGRNDPVAWCGATGKTYMIDADFCETIRSTGWNFVLPFPAAPITAGKLFRFFMRIFKNVIPYVLILLCVGMILDMFVPVINSMIFTDVIPNSDRTLLGQLFFLLLVAAVAKTVIDAMSRKLIWSMNEVAQRTMQMALFDHVLRLPVDFFRRYTPGEMAMRSVGIQNLFSTLNTNCFLTIFNAAFLIFPVGMLFYYSAKMAMITLCFLLPMMAAATFFSVRVSKLHYRILSQQGEINGLLERFISSIGKLHAAGAENHALLVWIRKFTDKQEISVKSERCMMSVQLIFSVLNWGIFCVEAGVILWMFSKNEPEELINVGDFTGFISAMAIVSAALLGALESLKRSLQVGPVFKWLGPILLSANEENEETNVDQDKTGIDDRDEIRGGIELDNVSFSYDSTRQILNNVSIKAAPGEFIAITGESGAGKSTLLRLMLRFEKPSSGTVLYDGEDISDKNMTHIRSQIGVVLQNASLLPISILDNIIGTTSRFTEDDAWRAAELTGCADDIRSWPMQMQTILTGPTVSGGQKQRILLAHALIRDPKLIFLDEATSALDNRTQRIVIETLKKVRATKVVIAHRLSTIIDADRIYVLEHGSVVETGTYHELMEKQGVFAKMAARQLTDGYGE